MNCLNPRSSRNNTNMSNSSQISSSLKSSLNDSASFEYKVQTRLFSNKNKLDIFVHVYYAQKRLASYEARITKSNIPP